MQRFEAFFLLAEKQARHYHPIGRDVSSHPKHPGRFVPRMHRVKIENDKLKRIKNGMSRREVLTRFDINQLREIYRFALTPNKSVKLGNTGIQIRFEKGRYYLIK